MSLILPPFLQLHIFHSLLLLSLNAYYSYLQIQWSIAKHSTAIHQIQCISYMQLQHKTAMSYIQTNARRDEQKKLHCSIFVVLLIVVVVVVAILLLPLPVLSIAYDLLNSIQMASISKNTYCTCIHTSMHINIHANIHPRIIPDLLSTRA